MPLRPRVRFLMIAPRPSVHRAMCRVLACSSARGVVIGRTCGGLGKPARDVAAIITSVSGKRADLLSSGLVSAPASELLHRHEPLQLLEPVLDDDDLRCRGLIGGLLDHEESLAVGGHVIVPLLHGLPVT